MIYDKMILETKNLNNRIKNFESIRKDFFILDFDDYTKRNLILSYARLFCYFLQDDTEYKQELNAPALFRCYKSSSKKNGFHIKVRIANNIIENLYYRAFFSDDNNRIIGDLKRLNFEITLYDVCYKSKLDFDNNYFEKDFDLIEVLNYCGVKRRTFYKLIKYIRLKRYVNINLILNEIL